MAADFPSIQRPSKVKRTFKKKQIKSQFENGKVLSAQYFTKGMWVWELSWDYLPVADFYSIQDHFNNYVGATFTIARELLGTSTSKTVGYTNDEVAGEPSSVPGYYKFALVLEER